MQRRTPTIAVVGSLNMDLVTRTTRRPARGETLIGQSFETFAGGKGLNQAVAAARMGSAVHMIGRTGQDNFGLQLIQTLIDEGIATEHVIRDDTASTGIATIIIDDTGDNSIIIVSGANAHLSTTDIDRASDVITAADVLLLQLEIPLDTVQYAAHIAHQAGTKVLLNPAPAQPLSDKILQSVDVLAPNETETALLTQLDLSHEDMVTRAAEMLLARGVGATVLTLGAHGALLAQGLVEEGTQPEHIPGYRVTVVDTTAAGDAFCGALAVQFAEGYPLDQAVRYANAAGALTTMSRGAAPSIPSRAAIEQLLSAQS
ncbi:MAG: ribokinase, partial [Chloroflexota bacterium]